MKSILNTTDMTGKYWTHPEYIESLHGLEQPQTWHEIVQNKTLRRPMVSLDETPTNEWFWLDADEDTLSVNVHQSYFDIANAARYGGCLALRPTEPPRLNLHPDQLDLGIDGYESYFTPLTKREHPEWASLVLSWSDVFADLSTTEIHTVDLKAKDAVTELDSIMLALSHFRFEVPTRTPQLIDTYAGTITLGGQIAPAVKDFVRAKAKDFSYEMAGSITYLSGSAVLEAIGSRLFDSGTNIGAGVELRQDGRFVSNTGIAMETGSLEVLPDEVRNYNDERPRGYRYTSHILDSAVTQLWAFAGVARLIGDVHRHYEAEANF
jgi:hypothetical protein